MRNRTRAVLAISFLAFLYFLFSHTTSESDFRRTTEAGMARKDHLNKQGKEYMSDAAATAKANKELQDILDNQKSVLAADNVAEVSQSMPTSATEGENLSYALKSVGQAKEQEVKEIGVAGRKMMQKPKEVGKESTQPKYPQLNPDLGAGEEQAYNGAKVQKVVDPGKEAARVELQKILKRSPIIIFSKSQCPYSRRAKTLLLETYDINPKPYVVELDLMTSEAPAGSDSQPVTQGKALQNLLGELTGRKTVPNIMVAAHSIGGSDDVARMDHDGVLGEEIKKLAGIRVKVQKREV